jgi:hypothetical protein
MVAITNKRKNYFLFTTYTHYRPKIVNRIELSFRSKPGSVYKKAQDLNTTQLLKLANALVSNYGDCRATSLQIMGLEAAAKQLKAIKCPTFRRFHETVDICLWYAITCTLSGEELDLPSYQEGMLKAIWRFIKSRTKPLYTRRSWLCDVKRLRERRFAFSGEDSPLYVFNRNDQIELFILHESFDKIIHAYVNFDKTIKKKLFC